MEKKIKIYLAIIIILSFSSMLFSQTASNAYAQEKTDQISTTALSINIGVDFLEDRINSKIPSLIETIERRGVACAKNLKVKCNLLVQVRRAGRIKLNGEGDTFRLTIPVTVAVTAQGLGLIGKGIKEKFQFSIVVHTNAVLSISEDWQPQLKLASDFTWSKQPELRILGFIKVNIAKQTEPAIRARLAFREREAAKAIQDLRLREKAEQAWRDLHRPIILSEDPKLGLFMRPSTIAVSEVNISDRTMNFTVLTTGNYNISTSSPESISIPPLPELQMTAPIPGRFAVNLPVKLFFSDIAQQTNKDLPVAITLNEKDHGTEGTFVVRKLRVASADKSSLAVTADFTYDNQSSFLSLVDVFGWLNTKGQLIFSGSPAFNSKTSELSIQNIAIESNESGVLVDAIVALSRLPVIREHIEEQLVFDLSKDIETLTAQANASLNKKLDNGSQLSGRLEQIGISQISMEPDGLTVPVVASGELTVSLGVSPKE
jgi:hypothetical protein